ncbi:hypothetical protein QCA50_006334 [Cerrena zonata]|uniref:Peptidase A1 domain-containing protein n=1 Tax=Cerrena zonata TaxID=2478898 RepID=A0AAW0GNZ6_9APHY
MSAVEIQLKEQSMTISLSKRSGLTDNTGIVDIPHLIHEVLLTKSKYENGFKAYEVNTGAPHPLAKGFSAPLNLTRRATGAVALTSEQGGALWQGSISVGTPAQTFTVDFDTGSSDLFLPSSSCTTNCKGHKLYNPSSSSTSVDKGKTFSLQYGDGSSVSGEQYSEAVTIARLSATGQAIGAANRYSSGFSLDEYPPDGLLGMGYQSISEYNSPPLVQTLIAQGKIDQPIFAFKLASSGSELSIGGLNTKLYTGAFTTVPVTTKGYWQVNMDSVSANGKTPVGRVSSIIDTGTSLIIGDTANVKKFYASISGSKDASKTIGAGFYTVPCKSIPNVQMSFGGKAFSIAPSLFNLGAAVRGSSDCVGAIVGGDDGFWIIGDVFLQNVYTFFNLGTNQVGFATLK